MAKEVIDRQGAAEFVASAADTHAARVSEKFRARFGAHATHKEQSHIPDIGLAVQLGARAVRAAMAALVKASDENDRELADDAAPRAARDEAAAALVSTLVGIRGSVEHVYGDAGLDALGINGKTPAEPKAVQAHARNVIAHLENKHFEWPKPVQRGISVDPRAWLEELAGPMEALDVALKDVAREAAEAAVTGEAKARAMEAYDEVFGQFAAFLSATLELVGESDVAAKVVPSRRRPGRTQKEQPAAEPAGAGAAGGAGATGAGG